MNLKLQKDKVISSILYSFIGDAYAMPMDSLNPNYIKQNYSDNFHTYQQPQFISKFNRLAAGSFTDISATMYLVLEMLYDVGKIDEFTFNKFNRRLMSSSPAKKHDFELHYENITDDKIKSRPGLTNINRALPYTLLSANKEDKELEEDLIKLNQFTHLDENGLQYMLFHNFMIRDLFNGYSLDIAIFNSLKYLENEKDQTVILDILDEYATNGKVNISKFEHISFANEIEDLYYSNYPFALAVSLNKNMSLIEKFVNVIYMGGATTFNCSIIGAIHGIIHADVYDIEDNFLMQLHYGNDIRIINIYDLVESLVEKNFSEEG